MNAQVVGFWSDPPGSYPAFRRTEVYAPSETLLAQEYWVETNQTGEYSASVMNMWGGRYAFPYHRNGENYLFCDGHVSWLTGDLWEPKNLFTADPDD